MKVVLQKTLMPGRLWAILTDGDRALWTRRRSWKEGRRCQLCWKAIPKGDEIAGPIGNHSYRSARVHVACLERLPDSAE